MRAPLTAEGPFDLWLLTTTDPSVNPPGSFSSTKSRLTPHFCRTELYARVQVSSVWDNTANLGSSLWSAEQKPAFLMSTDRSDSLFQSLRVCTWGLLLYKKKNELCWWDMDTFWAWMLHLAAVSWCRWAANPLPRCSHFSLCATLILNILCC